MDLVRDLADVGAADRYVVGGKGASLGEVTSAGVRVPPGFVVTTGAFDLALAGIDPDGSARRDAERGRDAEREGAVEAAAGRLRERILAASMPDAVCAEIARRYGALRDPGAGTGDGVPVAVRSSATFEDGGDASFAGVQDTYLWVRGEAAVTDCVRRCWASLYSTESVSYRHRFLAPSAPGAPGRIAEVGRGAPGPGQSAPSSGPDMAGALPAMAVVVQRMVDARCSGVMFTCSPTSGDRSVVAVEATWGLGSALVSGCVTPDSYVVSKVTGEILKRTVPGKLRLHQRSPDGTGVVEAGVPAHLQQAACLTDEEIGELVRIARQVEDHYGAPQDIEWAIAHQGGPAPSAAQLEAPREIFVLQSRPETVWAGRETGPVAVPKRRAFDHVFDRLSGRSDGKVAR